MLGARKKSESETRKLRCAKPSAPKSSRRRMKPILDRTKSKAEAYAPGAAPKGTFPSPFSFRLFWLEFQRLPAVEGAPAVKPPFDVRFGHERLLLVTAFYSIKATMSALGHKQTWRHIHAILLCPRK